MRLSQVLRSARPVARREQGFSLVQLLAAVAVLLTLALALPAWLAVRVNQARIARAEREAEAIAEGIRRFERDFGFLPAWIRARDGGPGLEADAVDLLVGPGESPKLGQPDGWSSGRADTLRNQLIENSPGYRRPRVAGQPTWRDPYLASPPGSDPWQNRYMANVGVSMDPPSAGPITQPTVFVISAGPNGIVETPYRQPQDGARAVGDDVAVRVR